MTVFSKRRKQLMQQIGHKGILILPAARELVRNGDAYYPYRQQSDFYYLTGFDEPEAVIILAPKRKEGEYLLFNRIRNREHEMWDGPRAGQEGALQTFLADQAFPILDLEAALPDLLSGRDTIHYTLGLNTAFDALIMRAVNRVRSKIRSGAQSPLAFVDMTTSLHEMRLLKSREERTLIQKAIDITAKGHIAAMSACKPGMVEYELEARFLYECCREGARFQAYTPIIGAGKNTCILHYVANNQLIHDGDLVLIDAGCEYEKYASDITRTFPANGRFSAEQRAIYELVLQAQLAAIKAIKPGALYDRPQHVVVKTITQGLVDLGILKGRVDDLIEKKAYFPFYMHRAGHWLGLDVHDVGCYTVNQTWRPFQPGMLLTVEPGIYISSDIPGVHKRWHNIGVRIEDNVMVSDQGCDVLSSAIPKKIDDIETLMAQ